MLQYNHNDIVHVSRFRVRRRENEKHADRQDHYRPL